MWWQVWKHGAGVAVVALRGRQTAIGTGRDREPSSLTDLKLLATGYGITKMSPPLQQGFSAEPDEANDQNVRGIVVRGSCREGSGK